MKKSSFRFGGTVIVRFAKLIIYLLLIVAAIVLVVTNRSARYYAGIPAWYVLLPVSVFLCAENAVKLWACKTYPARIACYVFDTLLLMTLTIFSDGTLISTLYIIVLSDFYIEQPDLRGTIAMGVASMVLFLITFAISGALRGEGVNVTALIADAFNDLILLVLHFFVFNFTIYVYRSNREIKKGISELEEANEKLRLANEELKEVTALEERQRIAKDIHDTAGHSITTVIMQTEAARLTIDSDPADAKRKITAANLQAKHALEELRESVHLLSGSREYVSLKDALMEIVHESTDGTGIAVRADVEDITLCDAKRRFLCNSLKEGISNGLRHGGATAFYFELRKADGKAEFLLSDNGSGLEAAELKEGFGLKGMRARAQALGGDVQFDTEPGEGFEIKMALPLDGANGE